MNRYSRQIIFEFVSEDNIQYLFDKLNTYFNNKQVTQILNSQLRNNIMNYKLVIQKQLLISDPLPGITITDQINCYNNLFINERIKFIESLIDTPTESYTVSDGEPVRRNNIGYRSTEDTLKSWYNNSATGLQFRQDPASRTRNKTYSVLDANNQASIDFCDQNNTGTNNHIFQYENTLYKNHLNKITDHSSTVFGETNSAADNRLLSRRVFRTAAGVENGIPRYETSLYNRNLDRDIDEGLQCIEEEYQIRGFNMAPLKNRLSYIEKNKYTPSLPRLDLHQDFTNYY